MVRDFFRINMPYVIERDENGEWIVLNREYSPLGYPDKKDKKLFPEDYVRFTKIPQSKLKQLETAGAIVRRDETGQVYRIVFYGDGSAPVGRLDVKLDSDNWNKYCRLLAIVATITTK